RRRLHWQQPTQLDPAQNTLSPNPDNSGPSTPVPLLRSTLSPAVPVCAVAYSQLRLLPPTVSSMHWTCTLCVLSIAQNEVTVTLLMSLMPSRSPLDSALCS